MKRLSLIAAICAAVVVGLVQVLPVGDSLADEAAARSCLDSMISGAIASGMRLRAADGTTAGPQEAINYKLTLYKGLSYVLLGCADGKDVDLDMRLYDGEGNLVSNDKSPDAQPFVDVSPPHTGEYMLQVLVYKSEAATTDFAVGVAYMY